LNNRVYITLRAYAMVSKNNLPDLPTPSLTVQALSKNIVFDPALNQYKFDGNPTVVVSDNRDNTNTSPSRAIVVADSGRWVVVDQGRKR
jgi:hypothetical protein